MKTLATSILTLFFVVSSAQFSFSANGVEKGNKIQSENATKTCTTASTTTFQSNIFQNTSGKVSIIILKTDQEPVTVRVLDNQDNLLFTKTIIEDSVRQNLSMKELDPGQYKITLSKNGECFTKTVTVK